MDKPSNGDPQYMYNSTLVLDEILIVFTTNKTSENKDE